MGKHCREVTLISILTFQHALRLSAFGQIYKVLEMDPLPSNKSFQKYSWSVADKEGKCWLTPWGPGEKHRLESRLCAWLLLARVKFLWVIRSVSEEGFSKNDYTVKGESNISLCLLQEHTARQGKYSFTVVYLVSFLSNTSPPWGMQSKSNV